MAGTSDNSSPPPRRVVFFGDSRAAWWTTPRLPGVQCLSRGFPGAGSDELLWCFQQTVAPLKPDIVVLQLGVNDLAALGRHAEPGQLLAATGRNIAAVVAQARELGARVVLTTIFPPARGFFPDTELQSAIAVVNAGLRELAAPDVQLLDSAAVLTGPDGYVYAVYAEDELHLSAEGYAALNVALAPLIEQ